MIGPSSFLTNRLKPLTGLVILGLIVALSIPPAFVSAASSASSSGSSSASSSSVFNNQGSQSGVASVSSTNSSAVSANDGSALASGGASGSSAAASRGVDKNSTVVSSTGVGSAAGVASGPSGSTSAAGSASASSASTSGADGDNSSAAAAAASAASASGHGSAAASGSAAGSGSAGSGGSSFSAAAAAAAAAATTLPLTPSDPTPAGDSRCVRVAADSSAKTALETKSGAAAASSSGGGSAAASACPKPGSSCPPSSAQASASANGAVGQSTASSEGLCPPLASPAKPATPGPTDSAFLFVVKDARDLSNGQIEFIDTGWAFAGDLLEYRLLLQNRGRQSVANLVVSDSLPAGLIYQTGSARLSKGGTTISLPDGLVSGGLAVPNFAPGENATLSFRVKIEGGVPINSSLVNLAVFSSESGAKAEDTAVTVIRAKLAANPPVPEALAAATAAASLPVTPKSLPPTGPAGALFLSFGLALLTDSYLYYRRAKIKFSLLA